MYQNYPVTVLYNIWRSHNSGSYGRSTSTRPLIFKFDDGLSIAIWLSAYQTVHAADKIPVNMNEFRYKKTDRILFYFWLCGSAVAAHLTGMHSAIKMLNVRIKVLHNLLVSIKRGKSPPPTTCPYRHISYLPWTCCQRKLRSTTWFKLCMQKNMHFSQLTLWVLTLSVSLAL